ncbi:hypothetical protein BDK51DRAFT_38161, partial [Blyttiomyces helicus]
SLPRTPDKIPPRTRVGPVASADPAASDASVYYARRVSRGSLPRIPTKGPGQVPIPVAPSPPVPSTSAVYSATPAFYTSSTSNGSVSFGTPAASLSVSVLPSPPGPVPPVASSSPNSSDVSRSREDLNRINSKLTAELNIKNKIIYDLKARENWMAAKLASAGAPLYDGVSGLGDGEDYSDDIRSAAEEGEEMEDAKQKLFHTLIYFKSEIVKAREVVEQNVKLLRDSERRANAGEEEITHLKTVIAALKTGATGSVALASLSAADKSRSEELEVQLRASQTDVAALQSKVALWCRASKRNQEARIQAEACQKTAEANVAELRARLAASEESELAHQARSAELEKRLDTLTAISAAPDIGLIRVGELEARVSELELELSDANTRVARGQEDLVQARARVLDFEQTMQMASATVEELETENSALRADLREKERSASVLAAEAAEMEPVRIAAVAEAAALQEKIAALEVALASTVPSADHDALREVHEALEHRFSDLSTTHAELVDSSRALEQQHADLSFAHDQLLVRSTASSTSSAVSPTVVIDNERVLALEAEVVTLQSRVVDLERLVSEKEAAVAEAGILAEQEREAFQVAKKELIDEIVANQEEALHMSTKANEALLRVSELEKETPISPTDVDELATTREMLTAMQAELTSTTAELATLRSKPSLLPPDAQALEAAALEKARIESRLRSAEVELLAYRSATDKLAAAQTMEVDLRSQLAAQAAVVEFHSSECAARDARFAELEAELAAAVASRADEADARLLDIQARADRAETLESQLRGVEEALQAMTKSVELGAVIDEASGAPKPRDLRSGWSVAHSEEVLGHLAPGVLQLEAALEKLHGLHSSAQTRLIEASAHLTTAKTDLASTAALADSRGLRISELEQTTLALRSTSAEDMDDAKEAREASRAAVEALGVEVANAKEELGHMTLERDDLLEELKETMEKLKDLESEITLLRGDTSRLEAELAISRTTLAEAGTYLRDAEALDHDHAQHARATEEAVSVRAQYEEAVRRASAYEAELESSRSITADLSEKLAIAIESLRIAEGARGVELAESQAEVPRLTKELERTQTSLEEATTKIVALQETIQRLEVYVETSAQASAKLSAIEAELSDTHAAKSSIENELNVARASLAEIVEKLALQQEATMKIQIELEARDTENMSDLHAELADSHEKLLDAETEVTRLKTELAAAAAAVADSESKLLALQSQLIFSDSEASTHRAAAETHLAALTAAESTRTLLSQEVERLTVALADAEAAAQHDRDLGSVIAQLQVKLEQMGERTEELEFALEKATAGASTGSGDPKELETLRARVADSEATTAMMMQQLQDKAETISELEERFRMVREQLARTSEEMANKVAEVDQARSALEAEKRVLDEHPDGKKQADPRLVEALATIDDLRRRLDEQMRISSLDAASAAAGARTEELERSLADSMAKADSLAAQLNHAKEELAACQTALHRLERDSMGSNLALSPNPASPPSTPPNLPSPQEVPISPITSPRSSAARPRIPQSEILSLQGRISELETHNAQLLTQLQRLGDKLQIADSERRATFYPSRVASASASSPSSADAASPHDSAAQKAEMDSAYERIAALAVEKAALEQRNAELEERISTLVAQVDEMKSKLRRIVRRVDA